MTDVGPLSQLASQMSRCTAEGGSSVLIVHHSRRSYHHICHYDSCTSAPTFAGSNASYVS
jgi:hypothetical protein